MRCATKRNDERVPVDRNSMRKGPEAGRSVVDFEGPEKSQGRWNRVNKSRTRAR